MMFGGPQGTLYGANSIGGLIKYVMLDPSLTGQEFHIGGGIFGVEHGDEPGWDAHIGGTVPLVNGTVGLRLSYARNDAPGFIDNVVNGEHGINDVTQQAAVVGLLFALSSPRLGNASKALTMRTWRSTPRRSIPFSAI